MNIPKVSNCQSRKGNPCGWSRFTKVAGWWLQLSIKADLSCSEAALLLRMFAVERHIFPVRNHGVCNVEWPALHSTNKHTASLSRDETASCENEDESNTSIKYKNMCCKLAYVMCLYVFWGQGLNASLFKLIKCIRYISVMAICNIPYLCNMEVTHSSCHSTGR